MLSLVDVCIIILYLVGTVVIGILCRGKQEDADDYFTAKGGMGGFFSSILVGLSIAATLFSGISFLAYPSIVYSNGIGVLFALVTFFIAWGVLVLWFLPRYLNISGTHHPYDIIEQRLGSQIRTLAACMYLLLRIGWMAALIYAPTVAIMAATGVEGPRWFWTIVFSIGFASTIYTTLGGIRGVIVTDAIQFVVIAVGVGMTIVVILVRLPVSSGELVGFLHESGHLHMMDFSLDPTKAVTLWTILFSMNIATLSSYMADQMSLQRYLATGSIKAVSRSFLTNTIGVVLLLALLAMVGLSLFAWYHFSPDSNMPSEIDKIFPYFVATQLPVGVAGLLLAAILAATMSSMTSGINTLSATISLDFRARMGKPLTPKQQLKFGRRVSLIVGLASTLCAGLVNALGDIFQMTQALLGLFLGPILACMFLAVLNKPIRKGALIIGMLLALIVGCWVTYSPVANTWVPGVSFAVAMFVTAIGTLLLGPNSGTKTEETDDA